MLHVFFFPSAYGDGCHNHQAPAKDIPQAGSHGKAEAAAGGAATPSAENVSAPDKSSSGPPAKRGSTRATFDNTRHPLDRLEKGPAAAVPSKADKALTQEKPAAAASGGRPRGGQDGGMNRSQQDVQQPNPFVSGPGQANMAPMNIANEEQMKMMQMRMMQMQSNMPQMQATMPPSHFKSHQMNFALAAMQQQQSAANAFAAMQLQQQVQQRATGGGGSGGGGGGRGVSTHDNSSLTVTKILPHKHHVAYQPAIYTAFLCSSLVASQ
jgi:hypothetical protein